MFKISKVYIGIVPLTTSYDRPGFSGYGSVSYKLYKKSRSIFKNRSIAVKSSPVEENVTETSKPDDFKELPVVVEKKTDNLEITRDQGIQVETDKKYLKSGDISLVKDTLKQVFNFDWTETNLPNNPLNFLKNKMGNVKTGLAIIEKNALVWKNLMVLNYMNKNKLVTINVGKNKPVSISESISLPVTKTEKTTKTMNVRTPKQEVNDSSICGRLNNGMEVMPASEVAASDREFTHNGICIKQNVRRDLSKTVINSLKDILLSVISWDCTYIIYKLCHGMLNYIYFYNCLGTSLIGLKSVNDSTPTFVLLPLGQEDLNNAMRAVNSKNNVFFAVGQGRKSSLECIKYHHTVNPVVCLIDGKVIDFNFMDMNNIPLNIVIYTDDVNECVRLWKSFDKDYFCDQKNFQSVYDSTSDLFNKKHFDDYVESTLKIINNENVYSNCKNYKLRSIKYNMVPALGLLIYYNSPGGKESSFTTFFNSSFFENINLFTMNFFSMNFWQFVNKLQNTIDEENLIFNNQIIKSIDSIKSTIKNKLLTTFMYKKSFNIYGVIYTINSLSIHFDSYVDILESGISYQRSKNKVNLKVSLYNLPISMYLYCADPEVIIKNTLSELLNGQVLVSFEAIGDKNYYKNRLIREFLSNLCGNILPNGMLNLTISEWKLSFKFSNGKSENITLENRKYDMNEQYYVVCNVVNSGINFEQNGEEYDEYSYFEKIDSNVKPKDKKGFTLRKTDYESNYQKNDDSYNEQDETDIKNNIKKNENIEINKKIENFEKVVEDNKVEDTTLDKEEKNEGFENEVDQFSADRMEFDLPLCQVVIEGELNDIPDKTIIQQKMSYSDGAEIDPKIIIPEILEDGSFLNIERKNLNINQYKTGIFVNNEEILLKPENGDRSNETKALFGDKKLLDTKILEKKDKVEEVFKRELNKEIKNKMLKLPFGEFETWLYENFNMLRDKQIVMFRLSYLTNLRIFNKMELIKKLSEVYSRDLIYDWHMLLFTYCLGIYNRNKIFIFSRIDSFLVEFFTTFFFEIRDTDLMVDEDEFVLLTTPKSYEEKEIIELHSYDGLKNIYKIGEGFNKCFLDIIALKFCDKYSIDKKVITEGIYIKSLNEEVLIKWLVDVDEYFVLFYFGLILFKETRIINGTYILVDRLIVYLNINNKLNLLQGNSKIKTLDNIIKSISWK